MLKAKIYRWMIVSISCASLLAPSTSYGCWCNWFKKQAAPALACNPCNPCAVQQTVSYVPQTCYRTQYVCMPVTTYRPVRSCWSPCNPCATTTMQPVVTNVQRAVLVPYTTYRMVYTAGVASCAQPAIAAPAIAPPTYAAPALSGCSSCGTATVGYAAPMTSGCSTCGPAAAAYAPRPSTPMYSTPAYASPLGSPAYSTPTGTVPTYSQPAMGTYSQPGLMTPPASSTYTVPSTTPTYTTPSAPSVGPATGTPSLSPTPGPAGSTPSNTLKPIPDSNINNGSRVSPSSSPRLIDPDSRTTSIPVYRPWSFSTVAWPNPPAAEPTIRTVSATVEQEPAPVVKQVAKPAAKPARTLAAEDGWRPSGR